MRKISNALCFFVFCYIYIFLKTYVWDGNIIFFTGTDNVFAPKDIDLEDNSIDAEERELEAFKRFCQEPVPPQRQEVTHLNVQKIIIKKNHPS